jgi:hypothetical protein
MDRIATVRAITDAERLNASEETVINGAPFFDRLRAVSDRPACSDTRPNDQGPDLDCWLDETEAAGKI